MLKTVNYKQFKILSAIYKIKIIRAEDREALIFITK